MVNIRKIGAIATGALFIGATFGMASAVTVPSGIGDKLASGGVAKAQLVVGAAAPGLIEDTASATEIQDAVKAKLTGTVGGDLSIEYGANELYDASALTNNYPQAAIGTDATVSALSSSLTLRFDGNADGDLKDTPDDYDLYNALVVIDQSNGDIQFAYNMTEYSTYSNNDGTIDAGDVVEIKGEKYVVTDNETLDNDIELGPAITKTLSADALDKDNAVVISGTKAMLYTTDGMLRFYDAGSQVETPLSNLTFDGKFPYKLVSGTDITSDEFTPYYIYVVNETDGVNVKVTMVEKSQVVKYANDEDGALGYSSIKVGDTDWFSGGNSSTDVFFLGDPISLVKGETIDLADTYYQLKYTTSKQFDILRKKTSAIASGTKLKGNTEPGSDFLEATDTQITVTTTGGTAATEGPALSIVDEATANKAMNLVLVGGPVANTLTSDLVTNSKSTVDWYNSDGDIEVISSAFQSGKYGIIVAGKDRFTTKDAAAALAADL